MKLFIPAVYYRARAIVERTWGWSPVEEAILNILIDRTGTSIDLAAELEIPRQVSDSTISRLMRFGLIELQLGAEPALTVSEGGRAHLLSGRGLPERSSKRTIPIGLVFELLGGSVLRNKHVRTHHIRTKVPADFRIHFPDDL